MLFKLTMSAYEMMIFFFNINDMKVILCNLYAILILKNPDILLIPNDELYIISTIIVIIIVHMKNEIEFF